MTEREVVAIAFRESKGYAVVTFSDGAKEVRKCSLWEASEWAGLADLPIVLAADGDFGWERPSGRTQ